MAISKVTISAGVEITQLRIMERLVDENIIESKSAFLRDAIDEHLKKYEELI